MARTIDEIIASWQQTEAEILKRQFGLSAEAVNLSRAELEGLASTIVGEATDETADNLIHAGARTRAAQLRVDYKNEYVLEYTKFIDALQSRKAEIELALFQPARDARPEFLYEVANASSEKLRAVMELSQETGNMAAGDVAFAEAWRRSDGMLVGYYGRVRGAGDEAWQALYEELIQAEAVTPITDPADRFERLFDANPGPFEIAAEHRQAVNALASPG